MTMQVRLTPIRDNRERVHGLWREYCAACEHSYFLSPGWMRTWIECFADQEALMLMEVLEHGGPAFAAVVNRRSCRRSRIIPSRVISAGATGDCHKDSLFLVHNQFLNLCGRPLDLPAFLEAMPRPWDELNLPGLSLLTEPGCALNQLDQRWIIYDYVLGNFRVDLDKIPAEREGYFATRSKKTRSQLRRGHKYYAQTGGVDTAAAAGAQEAASLFDELCRLHRERFSARTDFQGTNEHYLRFIHALIRDRFASGEIELLRFSTASELLGYILCFVYQDRAYAYQAGFQYTKDNFVRPGLLSHAEAIVHHAKAGRAVYDFLAGNEHYKERLATDKDSFAWARILRPGTKTWVLRGLRRLKQRLGRAATHSLEDGEPSGEERAADA